MNLEKFFGMHSKVAIAFSGGVDSAYLLYVATRYGVDIHAYYVKSAFQPQFELDDAKCLAEQLNVKMTVIPLDVLVCDNIARNPSNRCYYCKRAIFQAIAIAAETDGFTDLLDGTNASDEEGDRPGMKALRELNVLSPLRECGLTKHEVRSLSKEAGLFTWDKPAYACLATRISTGELITREKLQATETAEKYLSDLGFTDFRVRMTGKAAKLQLKREQFGELLERREEIVKELKKHYSAVLLDIEERT